MALPFCVHSLELRLKFCASCCCGCCSDCRGVGALACDMRAFAALFFLHNNNNNKIVIIARMACFMLIDVRVCVRDLRTRACPLAAVFHKTHTHWCEDSKMRSERFFFARHLNACSQCRDTKKNKSGANGKEIISLKRQKPNTHRIFRSFYTITTQLAFRRISLLHSLRNMKSYILTKENLFLSVCLSEQHISALIQHFMAFLSTVLKCFWAQTVQRKRKCTIVSISRRIWLRDRVASVLHLSRLFGN